MYDFETIHMKGSRNPSDYLSRHSTLEEIENDRAEEYVNFLTLNCVPKAMTLDGKEKPQHKDKIFQCIAYI